MAAVAQPADDGDLMPLDTLDLGGGFVEQGRIRQDRDLGEILREAEALRLILNPFAHGQQEATGQQHERRPGQR